MKEIQNERLKKIIERMKEYSPQIFNLYDQENENIEEYFKKEFDCEHIPSEFLEFYKYFDGCSLLISSIYSINNNGPLFKSNSDEKSTREFCKFLGINYENNKYFIFANDGMGGAYAFIKNKPDEQIYYLDHEFPDTIESYKSFYEYLSTQVEMGIDIETKEK